MGFMTTMRQAVLGDKIKRQARDKDNVIYGGRSVVKQTKPWSVLRMSSRDWDVLASDPKKAAGNMAKRLNKSSRSNDYFVKPAMYPGTFKVMSAGLDKKKNTRDDYNVADYSQKPNNVDSRRLDGNRYSSKQFEARNRLTSLSDPNSRWRYKKDAFDLFLLGK